MPDFGAPGRGPLGSGGNWPFWTIPSTKNLKFWGLGFFGFLAWPGLAWLGLAWFGLAWDPGTHLPDPWSGPWDPVRGFRMLSEAPDSVRNGLGSIKSRFN